MRPPTLCSDEPKLLIWRAKRLFKSHVAPGAAIIDDLSGRAPALDATVSAAEATSVSPSSERHPGHRDRCRSRRVGRDCAARSARASAWRAL